MSKNVRFIPKGIEVDIVKERPADFSSSAGLCESIFRASITVFEA
ncbi:hypothetical protein [Desulfosporosinus sp. Sb-LF]|nr:hypothetical protein [Desulfosporosinus sp. Sb-LF]